MKIFALTASPKKDGNTYTLTKELLKGAEQNSHETEIFHIYDKKVNPCIGCMACTEGKVEVCIHNDDFTKIAKNLTEADLFIFATPVFFGQITGPAKTFIDRMFTFVVDENFSIRGIKEKKFITIVVSGAEANTFTNVTDYLNQWLGDFFSMEKIENLKFGNLHTKDDLKDYMLEKAYKTGLEL